MIYQHEIELVTAAIEACTIIAERFVGPDNQNPVTKDDATPVTVADFAIQAVLAITIRQSFPRDTIVGEENADELRAKPHLLENVFSTAREACSKYNQLLESAPSKPRHVRVLAPENKDELLSIIDDCGNSSPAATGGQDRVWIIDPIDGTKSFIKGELYAINVAMIVGHRQVLGLVGAPNMSWPPPMANPSVPASPEKSLASSDGLPTTTWHDMRGTDLEAKGCLFIATSGEDRPSVRPLMVRKKGSDSILPGYAATADAAAIELAISDASADTPAALRFVTCTEVDSGLSQVQDAVMGALASGKPRSDILSWVLRWVCMATGTANSTVWVYKKPGGAKIWDHAGAMLLFEKAGGKITDVEGKPIDLAAGRKFANNWGFVAAPKPLHSLVLTKVQEALREREG